ncbi:MAG TPA: glycosyltransferase [Bryobacteraceae bacterium]|nr:glycosyltransferase [Bryobacteraceae bacterium]
MSSIRLAYLLSQYPAVNHVFMLREVRLLRELGFEIHVASIRGPDRDAAAMTAAEREEARSTFYVKGSSLFRVALAHLNTLLSRPLSYFAALFNSVRYGAGGFLYFAEAVVVGYWMKQNRLSHLHTHYASTVAVIVARIFPIAWSLTVHGPAEFQNPRFRLAEKIQSSLFACAISQYGLDQLVNGSAGDQRAKLELTLLGVDPEMFPPRRFRPVPVPFQIICVSRLAPVKGQHVLIEAVALLAKEGRPVRLRLVGDGPDRHALEQQVEKHGLAGHVVFNANVNQDGLQELYRGSDALALSSFAEGLPVVLMEAMSLEIPCVASGVNGVPEIITHEVDGLLVPPGDAPALAAAIARLMDDEALRRRLGENARRKILEKFNLQRNTERLADVFRRRLSN